MQCHFFLTEHLVTHFQHHRCHMMLENRPQTGVNDLPPIPFNRRQDFLADLRDIPASRNMWLGEIRHWYLADFGHDQRRIDLGRQPGPASNFGFVSHWTAPERVWNYLPTPIWSPPSPAEVSR